MENEDNNIKSKENSTTDKDKKEFKVTVESVTGRVDYGELIKYFGTELVTPELLDRFAKITGKSLHPWLSRGIFFSHRDLSQFLDAYENGDPVFLYTGRGPSSDAMHIGHLIPFMFTKWLQDAFDCPLVIQLSDEEKYAFKKGTFQELHKMGFENARDIVSVGFNKDKTFIFSNRDYRLACPKYEMFVSDLKVNASVKEVSKVFGFSEDCNVGVFDWPFYQSAASFSQAFPHIFGGRPAYCLIPCAIDQDPYFRLGRDLAQRLNLLKTSTIYCSFLPPLFGLDGGKMSSSVSSESTLFLNDDYDTLKKKIEKFAKSGSRGNGTLEDHKKLGGDVNEDISCQYLKYFEMDDEVLNDSLTKFSKGELTCKEMKQKLVDKLAVKFKEVSDNRLKLKDEELLEYYKIKPMQLPKPKEKEKTEDQKIVEEFLNLNSIDFVTTYHNIPVIDDDTKEIQSKVEGTLCKAYLLHGQGIYYLAVYDFSSPFASDKIKLIAKQMGLKKLSIATKDTSKEILKSEGSYTSLLGLIHDKEKKISEIWIDSKINKEAKVNFSPLRPDARVTITYNDMMKIADLLKIQVKEFKPNEK